jgi:O-methyltransferase domain
MLKQLADACAPDSKVLIVEQILTNPPGPLVAYTDFVMINIGGKERTLKNFTKIAEEAGLKVDGLHMSKHTPVGIVECSKA